MSPKVEYESFLTPLTDDKIDPPSTLYEQLSSQDADSILDENEFIPNKVQI